MRRLIWIGLALIVILAGVGFATKGMGFTARADPSGLETRLALAARRWATPGTARSQANPVTPSKEALEEGMAHWADHCATCHANDGSGDTPIGRSLYPRAPDMREARTQGLTDGELFYITERGIPFTGMPAWSSGTAESERDSWRLVLFIRHLPKLTPAEIEHMEKLNPKSPADRERDKHIDDFLRGK